jgi:hypothetical protein
MNNPLARHLGKTLKVDLTPDDGEEFTGTMTCMRCDERVKNAKYYANNHAIRYTCSMGHESIVNDVNW